MRVNEDTIRGLPGSGKTTLAHKLAKVVCEADDYFVDVDGVYRFDGKRLSQAHKQCHERCEAAMRRGEKTIAVANTFTRKWEYGEYLKDAERYGYAVQIIICTSDFGNVHGVPHDTVEKNAAKVRILLMPLGSFN